MQEVAFEVLAPDGFPLRGKMNLPDGASAPVVLMVHGFKGFMDWGFMPLLSERLVEAGIATCRFNMSSSGIGKDGESYTEKRRFETATYSQDLEEIAVIVGHLVKGKIRGAHTLPGQVGIFGHSRGGGMAILAAQSELLISTMGLWAPISKVDRFSAEDIQNWRRDGFLRITNSRTGDTFKLSHAILEDVEERYDQLNILSAAANMDIPTLIIHGGKDETVPFSEGNIISQTIGKNSNVIIVPGATHTFGATHPLSDAVPDDLTTAIQSTVEHFTDQLL
ncbi:MAG: alpha/beta fold hydrolase [bacterium]|nr:alpha/beta fold hydrolase [bacterium]